MSDGSNSGEALAAAAWWVATLLLRELDGPGLDDLRREELAPSLAEAGIELPSPGEEAAWLDERAADYHDLFLSPQGGPLVQSLWTEGRYEGTAAARVRQFAAAAGLELDGEAARGAAPDHLGCILRLWCLTRSSHPDLARELRLHHLAWARRPLVRMAGSGGFYGGLARIALGVIGELEIDPLERRTMGLPAW